MHRRVVGTGVADTDRLCSIIYCPSNSSKDVRKRCATVGLVGHPNWKDFDGPENSRDTDFVIGLRSRAARTVGSMTINVFRLATLCGSLVCDRVVSREQIVLKVRVSGVDTGIAYRDLQRR